MCFPLFYRALEVYRNLLMRRQQLDQNGGPQQSLLQVTTSGNLSISDSWERACLVLYQRALLRQGAKTQIYALAVNEDTNVFG